MRKFVMASVILGCLVFVACNPPSSGGANSTRVVTGTITVPSLGDWTNLKLGVFSGGDLGAYPKLATADYFLGVGSFRVIYSNLDDASNVPIPPVAGASYSIADTSTTSSAYSFELPATIPMYQKSGPLSEYYYFAAWIDGGATGGSLDLSDASSGDATHTELGEFNRCATKATTDNNHLPTTITIDRFQQSVDTYTGNPTGNYKYAGYDNNAYNEQLDVTTSSNGGFNFNMSPNAGW
jgi:hypothetical protein